MKKYCIIVAGGSGRRMKSATPKQFLPLAGRPVLMHTLERFSTFDPDISIILVLPAEHHPLWHRLCREYSFEVSHRVVAGGEERFHSVKAGLDYVAADTKGATETPEVADVLIAIHDGVRPLVSHDTIWRCYSDAEEFGNAVPFIEPADSVRVLSGDDSMPVPRNQVRLIQTPQVFRGSVIIKAYEREYDPSFTDDATVAEADGVKIHLTHGNRENLKITTPVDLAVAATLAGMPGQ